MGEFELGQPSKCREMAGIIFVMNKNSNESEYEYEYEKIPKILGL